MVGKRVLNVSLGNVRVRQTRPFILHLVKKPGTSAQHNVILTQTERPPLQLGTEVRTARQLRKFESLIHSCGMFSLSGYPTRVRL